MEIVPPSRRTESPSSAKVVHDSQEDADTRRIGPLLPVPRKYCHASNQYSAIALAPALVCCLAAAGCTGFAGCAVAAVWVGVGVAFGAVVVGGGTTGSLLLSVDVGGSVDAGLSPPPEQPASANPTISTIAPGPATRRMSGTIPGRQRPVYASQQPVYNDSYST